MFLLIFDNLRAVAAQQIKKNNSLRHCKQNK